MTDELLGLEEIAEIYRVAYRTARDSITKRKGFPPPIPGSTRKKPLWLREAVETYMRGEMTHA